MQMKGNDIVYTGTVARVLVHETTVGCAKTCEGNKACHPPHVITCGTAHAHLPGIEVLYLQPI